MSKNKVRNICILLSVITHVAANEADQWLPRCGIEYSIEPKVRKKILRFTGQNYYAYFMFTSQHHNKKALSSQAKTEVTSNDCSLRMRTAKHNRTIIIRSRFRLEYKNVFMHFIWALFKRCYSFRWSSRFCRLPHECILALAWAINLHSLSMNQKKGTNESGILYSICEQTLCDIAQSQN